MNSTQHKFTTNVTEQIKKTTLFMLIQGMLRILFVLGWLIQFLAFFVLVENHHKFVFVTPFVNVGSKLSIFVVLIIYICILIFGLHTFMQNFDRNTTDVVQNIILLVNNIIIITSIRLFYQVLTAKANDFGILIHNRFYTIYYNFSLEEKLDWYPRYLKEMKVLLQEMNINLKEINLSILAEARDYAQFKQLMLQHLLYLKKQSESEVMILDSLTEIFNICNKLSGGQFFSLAATSFLMCVAVYLFDNQFTPMAKETLKLLKEILKKLGD